MRVLLTSFGAAGDVHPFLALGVALARRGHSATFALDPAYQPVAHALSIPFVSLGEPMPAPTGRTAKAIASPFGAAAFIRHTVISRLERTLPAIDAHLRDSRPDLIVLHHSAGLGVPWLARRHSIPFAMAAVAPASWVSVVNPSVYPGMPDRDRYSPLAMKVGNAVGRWALSRAIDPALSRAAASLGYRAPRFALFDEMFEGVANLGLWSPLLRPPAPDDKPRSHVVGFAPFDVARPMRDADAHTLRTFLDDGPPPVLFTFGTSLPHAAERFFRAAVEACRVLRARGLLLGVPHGFPAPGPEVLALPYAPLSEVAPRCHAAVHHGGLGTIAACLRAGLPMVAVPHAYDQFDNASRTRRLGLSVSVDRRKLSAQSLANAVQRAQSEPSFRQRAHELGHALASEDGAGAGARELETALAPAASA